jgi:hypothetical protein
MRPRLGDEEERDERGEEEGEEEGDVRPRENTLTTSCTEV